MNGILLNPARVAFFLRRSLDAVLLFQGTVTVLGCLLVCVVFLVRKTWRRSPGDILLFLSLAEGSVGVRWYLQAILGPRITNGSLGCTVFGIYGAVSSWLLWGFNTSLIFYSYFAIRYSLHPGRIPITALWLIPILYSLMPLMPILLNEWDSRQDELGFCVIYDRNGTILLLMILIPTILAIYVKVYFHLNTETLKESKKIYEPLRYQSRYVTLSILLYLVVLYWGYSSKVLPKGTKDVEYITKYIGLISRAIMSVAVFFYRFADPMFFSAFLKSKSERDSAASSQSEGLLQDDRLTISNSIIEGSVKRRRQNTIQVELHRIDPSSQCSGHSADMIGLEMKDTITLYVLSSLWAFTSIYDHLPDDESAWKSPGVTDERDYNICIQNNALELNRESMRLAKFTIPEIARPAIPDQQIQLKSFESDRFATILAQNGSNFEKVSGSLELDINYDRIRSLYANDGGRSHEFFFFTADNKLLLKSIRPEEKELLLNVLPSYMKHLKDNPDSLIVPFFGLFEVQCPAMSEPLTLVMLPNLNENVPRESVLAMYDLKGSRIGRKAFQPEEWDRARNSKYRMARIGKDVDFENIEGRIRLVHDTKEDIVEQMGKDVMFMIDNGLMDYSLLIAKIDKLRLEDISKPRQVSNRRNRFVLIPSADERNEHYLYSVGIIDYLQSYSLNKKLERFVKIVQFQNAGEISVMPPDLYGTRFQASLEKCM